MVGKVPKEAKEWSMKDPKQSVQYQHTTMGSASL